MLHRLDHRLCGRQVNFVDDRNDLQSCIDCKIQVADGLCFDSLRCVYNQNRPFTCGKRPGNFVREIHVPGCIDQIECVVLSVLRRVLHLDGVQLDRDPSFLLQVHVVEHLVDDKVALCDRAGQLQQAIRKRGFAMVDVRDDAEISKISHWICRGFH